MKNEKKKKNSGVGFYVVLCLSVGAIGVAGFLNSKKESDKFYYDSEEYTAQLPVITLSPIDEDDIAKEANKTEIVEQNEIVQPKEVIEEKKTNDTNVEVIENGESPEFYEGEIVESITIAKKPEFILPVDGVIGFGFTDGKLYYDKIMDDFRTHNGIDILADADKDVVASASGVVESIFDDTLGKTIVINHKNGYKTRYSNLDDTENLSEGMELNQGDFIAHVGTYAFGENTTEPHIHFEISLNDEAVNPEEYIK